MSPLADSLCVVQAHGAARLYRGDSLLQLVTHIRSQLHPDWLQAQTLLLQDGGQFAFTAF